MKNSLVFFLIIFWPFCEKGVSESERRFESTLMNDYSLTVFSFFKGKDRVEENFLFRLKVWIANDFFLKDSSVKFILEKDIHFDGNAVVQLQLNPLDDSEFCTGNLSVELLSIKSEVLSRNLNNRISDFSKLQSSTLFYYEAARKNGNSVALSFLVRISHAKGGRVKNITFEQLSGKEKLTIGNAVFVGRLGSLFQNDQSFEDVFLYYDTSIKQPILF